MSKAPEERANLIVDIVKPTAPYTPNPPWAASVRLQQGSFYGVNATYGGALAIRGLTTNVTKIIAYHCSVVGSGGGVYFQADPKMEEYVF